MKSEQDNQLLTALKETISAAFAQWLDRNKSEVLSLVRDAIIKAQSTETPRENKVVSRPYLTSADLAGRWQLHPESVRRILRQGRIPSVLVGRFHRVAIAVVEAIEKNGTVPGHR